MDMFDETTEAPIARIVIGLTPSEAAELRDALEGLLSAPPGGHEHIPSADYQREITVWLTQSNDGPLQ